MSYARRTDATHRPILETLRACGWYCLDVHAVPGFVDALVARRGVLRLLEIKDGEKSPSRQALTPAQVELHADLAAAGVPVVILTSVADALELR